jgi:hypothetical protein
MEGLSLIFIFSIQLAPPGLEPFQVALALD